MGSLLRPAYALTLGGQQWTQQALDIRVQLAAWPRQGRLTVQLPASAPISAGPGDPAILSLDGGEGSETVFTGIVASVSRGLTTIEVVAIDALGQMARFRPATTFTQASAGTVIHSLADDCGITTGDVADGVMLAFYAADPSRTAAEHAGRLAAWSGALLAVAGDGGLTASIIDATQAEFALRHGRELTGFTLEAGSAPDRVTVAGESGVGSSDSPDALRLTADVFAGNRPDGPSLGTAWSWEPALRTAAGAATAGAARQRRLAASRQSGRLDAFLQPKLRPGSVIEIADLPDGLAKGPYWLEQVRHAIGRRGATTSARVMQGGDSFDPSALLGSLAGAIGSVL